VITSEELRVAALTAAAKRGKWVARRRIFRRWLVWLVWSAVLPVIGMVAVLAALCGMAVWQYMGHDAAYVAAQKWMQLEFGSTKTSLTADGSGHASHPSGPASNSTSTSTSTSTSASMINLTDEATPDLQIDRHLTIKTTP
jgi:hypothetical protein